MPITVAFPVLSFLFKIQTLCKKFSRNALKICRLNYLTSNKLKLIQNEHCMKSKLNLLDCLSLLQTTVFWTWTVLHSKGKQKGQINWWKFVCVKRAPIRNFSLLSYNRAPDGKMKLESCQGWNFQRETI